MTYWWKGRWPRPRAKPALRSRQQLLTIVLCAIQLIQTSVNAGDCLSSRSDLGENDFILECTEDGNYKPIQCDNKTGYCFCVDQITGRPKSDTTTRNRSPNCDKSSINHSSSATSLPAPSYHHQVAPQSSSGYSSRRPKQSRDGSSNNNNNNKKRRANRRCPVGKRISFLSQLLSVIKNELHNRGLPGPPTRASSGNSGGNIRYPFGIPLGIRPKNSHNSVAPEPEIELISKKFNDFDTNSDQRMSPDEMRELISSIRLILDAHLDGCVNSLFDFCDSDQNSMISREEFVHCLDVRNTPKLNAAYSKRKKELRGKNSQEQQQDVSSSSEERTSSERTSGGISREMFSQPVYRPPPPQARPQTSNPQPSKHHQTGSGASLNQRRNVEQSLALFISANSLSPDGAGGVAGVTTSGAGNTGHISLLAESSPIGRKKESRKDCLVTQSNANESAQSNSRGSVFIPNCTKEGYYVSVQCHLSHCWCVSPISGQPIKHLLDNSTQSMRVCDLISKGCDHRRRTKFHARLRQLLQHSKQSCESVFGRIDRNRNQQLEQTEWKQYQQRLLSKGSTTTTTTTTTSTFNSRLQKCFRTEVNYCDQNGDEMVSKPEWIQCCNDNVSTTSSSNGSNGTGSKFHHQSGSSSSASFHATAFDAYNQKKNRHRSGPNPFKTILKSE